MSSETFSQDQLYDLVPQLVRQEAKQIKRVFFLAGALVGALALLALLALALPISAIAPAQPLAGAPNLVSYQGHLTNASGEPYQRHPQTQIWPLFNRV